MLNNDAAEQSFRLTTEKDDAAEQSFRLTTEKDDAAEQSFRLTTEKDDAAVATLVHRIYPLNVVREAKPEVLDEGWWEREQGPNPLHPPEEFTWKSRTEIKRQKSTNVAHPLCPYVSSISSTWPAPAGFTSFWWGHILCTEMQR